jgi:2-polyprenyl-3-methyl-5-hydroxy-6-metoxy-1,4-benzoquinol methylase
MPGSKYYHAPHLYELAFKLPPQNRWRGAAYRAVVNGLGGTDGETWDLLDVGCGAGVLSKMIALEYPRARIRAIDSSLQMIEYARRAHPHPSIYYRAQSFWDETGSYDRVTSAYCWHFFPLEEAAAKLRSIMRPAGRALIVATKGTPVTRVHRRFFRFLSTEALALHQPEDLSRSLKKEGFSAEWKMLDRTEGSYIVAARMA